MRTGPTVTCLSTSLFLRVSFMLKGRTGRLAVGLVSLDNTGRAHEVHQGTTEHGCLLLTPRTAARGFSHVVSRRGVRVGGRVVGRPCPGRALAPAIRVLTKSQLRSPLRLPAVPRFPPLLLRPGGEGGCFFGGEFEATDALQTGTLSVPGENPNLIDDLALSLVGLPSFAARLFPHATRHWFGE